MEPFISLCMIVKNEEKVIERCLSSIAHLVDEVIVVDTGSTDKTKELASRYTNHLYDLEWANDFSHARNFAASKASGKWIIVLDADEYVEEINFKAFVKELKEDGDQFNAYSVKIINFTGNNAESIVQNHHDRVYRNNGDIAYFRKIHEQFQSQNNQPIRFKTASFIIFHSGYLHHTVVEKDKKTRNGQLIESEMAGTKNQAFDHFNLANEKMSQGKYEEALTSYVKAYQLKKDTQLSWVPSCVIQIAFCLIQLKRFSDALEVLNESGDVYPSSPEFVYLKGEVFYSRWQLTDAKNEFKKLVENPNSYRDVILWPDFKEQMPNIRLGEIFLHEENYQEAIQHFVHVLNINKNNTGSIEKVLHILLKFHSEEEIAQFLKEKQLVSDKNLKAYLRACFQFGALDLAAHLTEDFKNQNTILYKICLIKKGLVKDQMDLNNVMDILTPETLLDLNKAGWINIVDLYLLNKLSEKDIRIEKAMRPLKKDPMLNVLKVLLEGEYPQEMIKEDLFIASLSMFIAYKQFHFVDELLKHVNKLDKETLAKTAALLYFKEFKAEALYVYDQTDWNYFTAQDYWNVIQSLVQTKNQAHALDVSQVALNANKNDMRFYQFILENASEESLRTKILHQAKKQFGESSYLNEVSK